MSDPVNGTIRYDGNGNITCGVSGRLLHGQVTVGLGLPAFTVHAREGHFTFDRPEDLLGVFEGTVGPREINLLPQRPFGGRIEGVLANGLGARFPFVVNFLYWT
jgi:hypothetical protein